MSRKKGSASAGPAGLFAAYERRDDPPGNPIASQATVVVTVLQDPRKPAGRLLFASIQHDPSFRSNEACEFAELMVSALGDYTREFGARGPAEVPAAEGEGTPCADPTPSTPA